MANKVKSPPAFVKELKQALVEGLAVGGIKADVSYESIPATKLYRFIAIANKFRHVPHSERQDLVWRIAEQHLDPRQRLRVSMILTLTKEEAAGE